MAQVSFILSECELLIQGRFHSHGKWAVGPEAWRTREPLLQPAHQGGRPVGHVDISPGKAGHGEDADVGCMARGRVLEPSSKKPSWGL
jgi:hypothetical protein